MNESMINDWYIKNIFQLLIYSSMVMDEINYLIFYPMKYRAFITKLKYIDKKDYFMNSS